MPTLSTTTNNAFRFPTSANNGTDFAIGLNDLASDIDKMWSSGTLAARPAVGTLNRLYWATDTKLLYQDNGTAWGIMLVAGAWTAITLGTGISAQNGGRPPSARLDGDVVRLKGGLLNTSGAGITAGTTLATLPAGSRPSATCPFPALGGATQFTIDAAGVLTATNTLGILGNVPLDSITYSLT